LLFNYKKERDMIKKSLLPITLICILGLVFVACNRAPQQEPNPDRDAAIALYNEISELRAQFLAANPGIDETQEPWGRAKAIFDLSSQKMSAFQTHGVDMYTEALPGMGQVRTVYRRALGLE
jgi:hypothetical protein